MSKFSVFVLIFTVYALIFIQGTCLASVLDFSVKAPEPEVGVPHSILVEDESIWIGGENGLVEYRSKTHIDTGFETSSWITDIDRFNDRYILATVFGSGIFLVDKVSHFSEKIPAPGTEAKSFWKTDVGNHLFVASTLHDIFVYDKSTYTELYSLRGNGVPLGELIVDLEIDEQKKQIWWIDQDRGLFQYDQVSGAWKNLIGVSELTGGFHTLHKKGTQMLVGTDTGVISLNTDTQLYQIITKRERPKTDKYPVRSIFADSKGNVWAAAETLYKINFLNNSLSPMEILQRTVEGRILIITDIAEDSEGNLYAVDTTEGFVALSQYSDIATILTADYDKQSSLRRVRYSQNGKFILLTDSMYETKVFDDRQEKMLNSEGIEKGKLIRSVSRDYLLTENYKLTELGELSEQQIAPIGISFEDADFFETLRDGYLLEDTLYILLEKNGKTELCKYENGVVKQTLPYNISASHMTKESNLVVAVDGRGLFEIDAGGHVKEIEFGTDHSYEVYSSIESDDTTLLIGTSGSGLYIINRDLPEKSSNLNKYRFVRDALSIGDYWLLATNLGLIAVGKEKGEEIRIGRLFGVHDIDFGYDGIDSSSSQISVRGDKYLYELNKQELELTLESLSHKVHEVKRESLRLFGLDSKTDYSSSPKMMNLAVERLRVDFPPKNYLTRNLLQYEYFSNANSKWVRLDIDENSFTLPKLTPGPHTLQLRVYDPRSYQTQPITEIKFRVLPPWWQSWQALSLYGLVIGVLVLLTYKSYRKRVSEQGAYLSGLVREKNNVLAESNDSIRKILQKKQRVFTNLSHELRTPLSLVLGPVKQLQETITSATELERLQLVERNAERMQLLVDQMLEVENLDYVKELPLVEYNIEASARRILYDLSALAEMKSQTLKWQCKCSKSIRLLADSLDKIINNLVSNAIKYTQREGLIEVFVYEQDLHLFIEVKDNGKGMTVDEAEKIFERYTRFHDGEEGAGVGLALVKELVTANDGWVEVDTNQGVGTKFTVSLPMIDVSENETVPAEEKAQAVEEPEVSYDVEQTDGTKPVILIVDDNEEMRGYLQSVLFEKFNCFMAAHGKHALIIAEKVIPDLVITDFKMPDMDGFTLARAIRSNDDSSNMPIIMLSAFGDPESLMTGLEANVDLYLTKPISKEILLLRVQNLLSRHQQLLSTGSGNATSKSELVQNIPELVTEKDQQFYFALMAELENNFAEDSCTRLEIARKLAMSESQLHRKLKSLFGKTFTDFTRDFRMNKAKEMLADGKQITQIVYDIGFSSPSYFSRSFKEYCGVTPTEYQKQHYKPANKINA